MDTVPVRNLKNHPDSIRFPKMATLYKWHHKKQYPNVVYKVFGMLMFDIDAFNDEMAKKRNAHIEDAGRQKDGRAAA